MTSQPPSKLVTNVFAVFYVLSGVSQPMLMTLCKDSGLADASAQLYMVFYYLGPALLIFLTLGDTWPSKLTVVKACGIAFFDILAQALNYTGASLAGPTIFAIIYSSVTVWTAVWSRFVLDRRLSYAQWFAVFMVFGGLTLTATGSLDLGPAVTHGTFLVVIGSALHAGSYVLSEAVMHGEDSLSVRQNSGVQGLVACVFLIGWQLVYTVPRWDELIRIPMQEASTTLLVAGIIMFSFALANLVHSFAFYHTIRYYKGGSVSAGVMKGLQAVLVFVASHLIYCGRTGGPEMCFTMGKFLSLVTVTGGVVFFSWATAQDNAPRKDGYSSVENVAPPMSDAILV